MLRNVPRNFVYRRYGTYLITSMKRSLFKLIFHQISCQLHCMEVFTLQFPVNIMYRRYSRHIEDSELGVAREELVDNKMVTFLVEIEHDRSEMIFSSFLRCRS